MKNLHTAVRIQLAGLVLLASLVAALLGGGLTGQTVEADQGIAIACTPGSSSGNACGG